VPDYPAPNNTDQPLPSSKRKGLGRNPSLSASSPDLPPLHSLTDASSLQDPLSSTFGGSPKLSPSLSSSTATTSPLTTTPPATSPSLQRRHPDKAPQSHDESQPEPEKEKEAEAETEKAATSLPEDEEGCIVKWFHHSLSIGVDAKITMDFHLAREAKPQNFNSRGLNKFKYFTRGVTSIVNGCPNLVRAFDYLRIDDKVTTSKQLSSSIESLIFSNIPAYADGTDLWGRPTDSYKRQQVDDKLLEVVAHKGSINLVQIKAGVSKALQLGQGKDIYLKTTAPVTMQLDGEPWVQEPALIHIQHFMQVKMLVPGKKK
jgi:hypothetical protein